MDSMSYQIGSILSYLVTKLKAVYPVKVEPRNLPFILNRGLYLKKVLIVGSNMKIAIYVE